MSTPVPHFRQLGLPFPNVQHFATEDYLPAASNAAALAWIACPLAWPGLRLAVHGEAGCGKTHVLHVFARQHRAALLQGPQLCRLPELPGTQPIAVDDADDVPDQQALLHLLNIAAEDKRPVMLTGRSAPAHWRYSLPDLTSRLRAMQAVRLETPDDDLLSALLARLLADRQLLVAPAIQTYLRLRLPRTGGALREAVRRLDGASLALGGKITRAVAAGILARMGCEDFATEAAPGSIEQPALFQSVIASS